MTELQKNTKINVFEMFEDLSSKQEQLDYKNAVPFVHIPNELISEWYGNFIKDQKWYRKIWTDKQWSSLQKFDKEFNLLLDKLPKDLDDVPTIFNNPTWIEIMNLADLTFRELKKEE